jgi:acetyl-CoA carboxylase biotin carboxyl carrier protein
VSTDTGIGVPPTVTYREVQEVIRTFQRSGWTGMTLELRGLRITVGKDGPPSATPQQPRPATTAAPPAAARPVAAPPAAAPPVAAPASAARPAVAPPGPAADVDTTGCVAVRSPAVGAFWVAPAPGQPPFVAVGEHVDQDEQLAIVEVMKLMNPVVAAVPGEVVQVCAQNAEMVEYDQVLFWIRPSDE